MSQEMIPVFKPYDRMGQFGLDPSCVHNTYKEALAYAEAGRTGGKAFPGQIISVLNLDTEENTQTYVINRDYTLRGIYNLAESEEELYASFYANSPSGVIGCKMKAGFFLRSITLTIDDAFNRADALYVTCEKDGEEPEMIFEFHELQNMQADESNSIFVINVGEQITKTTLILVYFTTSTDQLDRGSGTIKIN